MFSSEEWRNCKWYKAKRGEAASSIVFSLTFWNHIAHAVRVFTPLVRLLRVVDADRRPSMGFVYGGLEEAKREIVASFNGVESSYKFFVDGVTSKTKGRLDTPLHLAAYYLNPFFFYTESRGDPDVVVRRGFKECVERFYPDLDVQDAITRDELPAYRLGRGDFGKPLAVRQRMTNDNNYDLANWWHNHGDDTPHLKAMAIKILSLTSSSSGCERNWSTFDSTLSASDLRDPQISSLIAAKLREFHDLDMPGEKNAALWNRLRSWLGAAIRLCPPDESKEFRLDSLEKEISTMQKNFSSGNQKIGFCHNDLQYGNIMMEEESRLVTIIDYEYASFNPVAYDIANHFCEMAADYHTDTPHILNYDEYPGLEEQKRFVRIYLAWGDKEPSNSEVDGLISDIEKYAMASHLLWGLWGIISNHVNEIDFDYKEYARQRFQQYWSKKAIVL